MLYITGDCHSEFHRFSTRQFPAQAELSKDDFVLICGDFGGVWDDSPAERYWLNWLDGRPFTTLFVDGNHENFDLLAQYPAVPWRGGTIHPIRPSVYHLCRGNVFDLGGRTLFVLGGAASHDAPDGILRQGPALRQQKRALNRRHARYRVEHESWWADELPSPAEYQRALASLEAARWKVDLVASHCAPTELHARLRPDLPADPLTDFLSHIRQKLTYGAWFCGHYHCEVSFPAERVQVVYQSIRSADRMGIHQEQEESE